MLLFEAKLKGKPKQFNRIDEAIITGQFIRNSCLRYWMDATPGEKIDRFSLNKYCKALANNPDFPWAAVETFRRNVSTTQWHGKLMLKEPGMP